MTSRTTSHKRNVCFFITSRVHYARQKKLLYLLRRNPRINLQLVVGGSILLDKYGERFLPDIRAAGFDVAEILYNVIEGGNHVTMAKTAALTGLEFANTLTKLNPDIVLVRGDRFEMLSIAMVAAYLNKTVAHIEGGDLSGTIDESVRHAITKLSHVHFVTNDDSRRRVIQMGEDPAHVHNVGSLDIEFAASVKNNFDAVRLNAMGTGAKIDFSKPFLVVMQHPVTTGEDNRHAVEQTLEAVSRLNLPAVWFWPNSDAGTADIAKAIRVWREKGKLTNKKIHFLTDLLPEDFIALIRRAACMVGNSSAGIKECSFLGTPVVNIGTRQQGRLAGPNVVDVGYDAVAIYDAVKKQISHGPYPRSDIYHQPNTSKRIAEVLLTVPLVSQKAFYELTGKTL